jgi:DNA-binding NarL/FixJ family response regulator
MPIAVAIVEDDAEICEELERIVSGAPGFVCVCSCRNADSALREIPSARPDVVVMDLSLPDGSGIECTRQLRRRLPDVQILVFTIHDDSERIFQALAAGASGYLLKRSSPTELLTALRNLVNGEVPMTGAIARKVLARFRSEPQSEADITGLTPREQTVLAKLAEGLSAKEIATELSISAATVNAHLKHIYRKLDVRSRIEAVIAYLK